MSRISGKNIEMKILDKTIDFEEVSLTIEDSGTVAMDRGRPNGYLDGEVKAKGDLTVDLENWELLMNTLGGSAIEDIPAVDIKFLATVNGFSELIEAFGCKLKPGDVFNAKGAGGEKMTRKISYEVTGKDFVNINGRPYLRPFSSRS